MNNFLARYFLRVPRLLGATLIAVIALQVVDCPQVSAHSASGAKPSNYKNIVVPSSLTDVEVRVDRLAPIIQIANHSIHELIVLGYENEPYLRLANNGTYVNESSFTYVANSSTKRTTAAAKTSDSEIWKKVSDGGSYSWRDKRIGSNEAKGVKADANWAIPISSGGEFTEVLGSTTYKSANNSAIWMLAVGGFFVLTFFFGRVGNSNGSKPVRICVIALMVGSGVQVLGMAVDSLLMIDRNISETVSLVVPFLMAWLSGFAGLASFKKGNLDGLWLILFAALVIFVVGGLMDVAVLNHSEVPFGLDPVVNKILVASSLGIGSALCINSLKTLARKGAAITK